MNPEIKAKWVAALRSGEYKQGRGNLRDKDNAFCCLGVLCDILDNTKWQDSYDEKLYSYGNDIETAGIPPQAGNFPFEALGKFTNKAGEIINLSLLNDSGSSFEEIADIIEKHL
jgi:hypothetical protein